MHGYRVGQGATRAKVLYFFRSPPNVQIGRRSMDAEVREALEHTHPDLTFDWDGLLREPMPPPRPDPRERGPRQRAQGRKEKPVRENVQPAPPPAHVVDDESLLGRTLGGAEAARLRGKHAELCHRIARRARTPEERDRLSESAQRLNPDTWTDEAAIRAGIKDIDARFEAVAAELPRRRRGRRGGKVRDDGGAPEGDQAAEAPDQETAGDVIIGRRDDSDESNDVAGAGAHDPSGAGGGRDNERAGGIDAEPAAESAAADAPAEPETDVR